MIFYLIFYKKFGIIYIENKEISPQSNGQNNWLRTSRWRFNSSGRCHNRPEQQTYLTKYMSLVQVQLFKPLILKIDQLVDQYSYVMGLEIYRGHIAVQYAALIMPSRQSESAPWYHNKDIYSNLMHRENGKLIRLINELLGVQVPLQ